MPVKGIVALDGETVEVTCYNGPAGGQSFHATCQAGDLFGGWTAYLSLSNSTSSPMNVYIGDDGPYSIGTNSYIDFHYASGDFLVQDVVQFRLVYNPGTEYETETYVDGPIFDVSQ